MSAFGALTPRRIRQLWYAPVLAMATALMMLRLFALARLLDVLDFAQLSAALLFSSTFVMLACLGLQALLQRDMPVMFVRGRERAARVLLTQSVLAAYACAVVGLVLAFASPCDFGSPTLLVALGLVHGLSQQLFLVASVESRSRGEPLRYAFQSLIRSVLIVGAGLLTAAMSRSALAVVGAEAAMSLLLAHGLLWQTVAGTRPRVAGLLRVAWRRMPRLEWHAALVLLVVSLVGFALTYADRWLAALLLGAGEFGNYAFAGTVLAIGLSAQSLINASVYPLLARLYARDGTAACYALCRRLSLLALAGSLVLAPPAYFLLEAGLRRWYPAYDIAQGLLAPFLLVACFRVSDFWSSFMMITGFQNRLLRTSIVAGGIAAMLWGVVTQPWRPDGRTPGQLAMLAVALAVVGYAVAALASRRSALEASA
jgi:O-antigen/teichoic acid export membrane protein